MSELVRYFLFLGTTGFGGPLVLIQQMRVHFVEEKKLLNGAEFDQAFALVKAMPGPVAIQMAVYVGGLSAGFWGGLAAGVCLILPAFFMMVLAGIFYDDIVANPYLNSFLLGILFSATGVILMSLKSLVLPNKKDFIFWSFLTINLVLFWFNVLPEPVLIISFGLLAVLQKRMTGAGLVSVSFLLLDWENIAKVAKICLYAGAVVFGTGYALLPVLKNNLVDKSALVTLKQFNDAVIFGQMTPGPMTVTATFLGYEISGFMGALVATICVFFFPVFHISTWFPKAISWMSRQKWIGWFVMGATSSVVAGIMVTLVHMNFGSWQSPVFWILFFGSVTCLNLKPKTPVLLIFLTSGLANLLAEKIL